MARRGKTPTKFWLSTLDETVTFAHLVHMTKLRWRIERDYLELKQEIGLGHFEGRVGEASTITRHSASPLTDPGRRKGRFSPLGSALRLDYRNACRSRKLPPEGRCPPALSVTCRIRLRRCGVNSTRALSRHFCAVHAEISRRQPSRQNATARDAVGLTHRPCVRLPCSPTRFSNMVMTFLGMAPAGSFAPSRSNSSSFASNQRTAAWKWAPSINHSLERAKQQNSKLLTAAKTHERAGLIKASKPLLKPRGFGNQGLCKLSFRDRYGRRCVGNVQPGRVNGRAGLVLDGPDQEINCSVLNLIGLQVVRVGHGIGDQFQPGLV